MSGKPTGRTPGPSSIPSPGITYEVPLSSVQGPQRDDLAYALLGGRVAMLSATGRDRPAIDGVLLAAAAPMDGAARVLDVGCGSGVVGLCVAARVASARLTSIDLSHDAVAETSANALRNGWTERFSVERADLASFETRQGFDIVLSNPPYHDPASSRPPTAVREQARFGDLSLHDWLRHCLRLCRPRGRLVVILRADRLPQALEALAGPAGDLRVLPIHPRSGDPASRVMIHARKAVRTPLRLLAGLALHEADGGWTEQARLVLEHGAGIDWERGEVIG